MFISGIRIWRNPKVLMVSKLHISKSFMMQYKYRYLCTSVVERIYLKYSKNYNYNQLQYNTMGKPIDIASEQEKEEFSSVFSDVFNTLVDALTDIPDLKVVYAKLLTENLGKEKQESGILAVSAYKMFEDPEKITVAKIRLASILGWCANLAATKGFRGLTILQILDAYHGAYMHPQLMCANAIRDDMMDSSEMRFGNPCWYKRNDVRMSALNDANLMADGIHLILKQYLYESDCYFPIVEWFHDVAVKLEIGHSLDHICVINGNPQFHTFTMTKYRCMVKHKTTYPLYLLPVTLGKYLSGKYNTKLPAQAETIFSELGIYMNGQNDILDCYGDPAITGKTSNDIREGKCTWLVVKALEKATSAQKQMLNEHYGKYELESERKIRILFDELGILEEFLLYEQDSFNMIREIIQHMPKDMIREFMNKITYAAYESIQ